MTTREMLRLSWRAWLSRSEARVGPWWIGYAWTVVFCLVVALGFTMVSMLFGRGHGSLSSLPDWWTWYQINVVVSLCIGFAVRIAFAVSEHAIGRGRLARAWPWQRSLYFMVVPLLGVSLGWPLGMLLAMGVDVRTFFSVEHPELFAGSVFIAVLITAIFQQFFWTKARQIRAENAATEAQLRLLQGQIRPHFIFNTLASLQHWVDTGDARAGPLLRSLTALLRTTTEAMDAPLATLGAECEAARHYLEVMASRLGKRLSWRVDIAADCGNIELPVGLVLTLVENAVEHGIEPMLGGGRVEVTAARDGAAVLLRVVDDGAGLAGMAAAANDAPGGGVGLANSRARLRHLYEARATLDLVPGPQRRGAEARLRIEAAP